MTENTFNTEELNSSINSPQYYVDDDGSFKFISPVLSSSNFDGSVPVFEGSASVSELISGMYIQIEGTDFFPIVNISKDDPGLEDSPSTDVVISYLDDQNEVQAAVYDLSDVVTVRYEDWDEKYLGTQGWLLTYGGNAIFSNVAVRGRIEAEEGFLSGLEVTGNINIGDDPGTPGNPGIVINQDGIFAYDSAENETFSITASTGTVVIGSGGGGLDLEQLEDYLNSASYINNPDLISGSYITAPLLANPGQTIINGGNITTGTISGRLLQTSGYSGVTNGSTFSSAGTMAINLSNGTITAPAFRIDTSGAAVFGGTLSAPGGNIGGFTIGGNSLTGGISPNISGISTGTNRFFANASSTSGPGTSFNVTSTGVLTATGATISGAITATSGFFGNSSYGMSITDNTGTGEVTLSLGTLRLGSKISSSVLHGTVDVYNTSGSRIGQLASSQSSKDWSGLGTGVILGTNTDYLFLPSSGNSTKPRIYGSGIEFWQTGGAVYSLALSGANFQVQRDLNVTSGYSYKVAGTTFLTTFRYLTVDGITNQSLGITNNGGQITSLPTYDNQASLTNNVHINANGVFRRNSSTQKIKHSIIALSEIPFGESVLKNKIVEGTPNINYLNVLNITPVEFKTIEDGVETNRTLLGFIAEDVADKVPEIATYDKNGEPEYYDVNGIVSGLLAIVQNQQKEINQLQDRLRVIEERLGL